MTNYVQNKGIKMIKSELDRSRCPLCDEWYDLKDSKEALIHSHPEPQSGKPRDDWMGSGLRYSDWIEQTEVGKKWANMSCNKY
jgi:hypothetical protein